MKIKKLVFTDFNEAIEALKSAENLCLNYRFETEKQPRVGITGHTFFDDVYVLTIMIGDDE